MHQALAALARARDVQSRVLSKVQVAEPENVKQQQALAASICIDMARQHEASKDNFMAVAQYKEALRHDEANARALLALAQVSSKKMCIILFSFYS